VERSYPLNDSRDLDPLLERIGDAQVVLLGEASHGTHEYYTWRSAISRRLITEKGFRFIAVEGDWPDCYRVNRYIKGYSGQDKRPAEVLKEFDRWPTWMWANWEVAALLQWLKDHNTHRSADRKVGFYGLDVYSLWESLEALVNYLKRTDPEASREAEKAMRCFLQHGRSEQYMSDHRIPASCRDEVVSLLMKISAKARFYDHDPEASLNMVQNANITVEAEKYYRSIVSFNDQSWNIRDRHMLYTLQRIMEFHGTGARAIIWAHNTHIGDARYTDMQRAGLLNLGELVRKEFSRPNTVLVGFGSYRGRVMAGRAWSAPAEEMNVPEAEEGSVEEALHSESASDRLLLFDHLDKKERFAQSCPHRAIGVVYHPDHETYNYVPSVLQERYDAFIYIDKTRALHAFQVHTNPEQVPETFPFEF
jgi:erythromycin esterase-like protein